MGVWDGFVQRARAARSILGVLMQATERTCKRQGCAAVSITYHHRVARLTLSGSNLVLFIEKDRPSASDSWRRSLTST